MKRINKQEMRDSQMCVQSDSQIDYHLKRINAIILTAFDKEKGKLMAEVFLRHTGALLQDKYYLINTQEIFAWFENLDYLKSYTEYDKL